MNPSLLNLGIFELTMIFMLVGLVGLFIPVFPGLLVIWLSALAYGLLAHFNNWLEIAAFVLITILWIVGMFIDNILTSAGARKGGATWLAIAAGTVAGLVFTFLLPPFGGIVAAPLAVFLVELLRKNNWRKAFKATGGMLAGWGVSFLARLAIGISMVGIWFVWAVLHG